MRIRQVIVVLALFGACKAPEQPDAQQKVRATVVAIRTTVEPGKRVSEHALVIASGRARSTGELDAWRLFDTKAGTVTFVDDVARSQRTEPFEQLLAARRSAIARAVPDYIPAPSVTRGGAVRPFHGVSASQIAVEAGRYRREIWLAPHPRIPARLYSMMMLTEPQSSPLAPMMRRVDDALADVEGFAMLDLTTVPLAGSTFTVRREVVSITEREVSRTLLELPDYGATATQAK